MRPALVSLSFLNFSDWSERFSCILDKTAEIVPAPYHIGLWFWSCFRKWDKAPRFPHSITLTSFQLRNTAVSYTHLRNRAFVIPDKLSLFWQQGKFSFSCRMDLAWLFIRRDRALPHYKITLVVAFANTGGFFNPRIHTVEFHSAKVIYFHIVGIAYPFCGRGQ